MNENIRFFIYNNDDNYSSYKEIKFLMISICMFMSLLTGPSAIVNGLWHFVIILFIINAAFLLHLLFLKLVYKNTYPMRFLSDGIVDVLISCLFLTSAFVILCANGCDTNFLVIGTLLLYMIYLCLLIPWMIKRSKSDIYIKYLQMGKKEIPIEIIAGYIIPMSGIIGMVIARIVTSVFDLKNNTIVYIVFAGCVVVSMCFSLGGGNFLKYYYCIRYKIICDQQGNTTSPNLCAPKKDKRTQSIKKGLNLADTSNSKASNKKIPLVIKVLFGILGAPIAFFIIVFLIFCIKEFIQEIS